MKTAFSFPLPELPFFALALFLMLQTDTLPAQQPTTATIRPATDTYRSSRTPTIRLVLGQPDKKNLVAKLVRLSRSAGGANSVTPGLIQPQFHGGVFDEVNLGYLDASGQAPAATVSLQFDASYAGTSVWVQPLDGGAILSQDAAGNPVSSPGGYAVALDASGQLTFGYQALAVTGRYQVLIRLDNVSSILPFIISDPNQDN